MSGVAGMFFGLISGILTALAIIDKGEATTRLEAIQNQPIYFLFILIASLLGWFIGRTIIAGSPDNAHLPTKIEIESDVIVTVSAILAGLGLVAKTNRSWEILIPSIIVVLWFAARNIHAWIKYLEKKNNNFQ